MKKTVLLFTISFALCMNAFGQIHKAKGDKPDFSKHYAFTGNDFIESSKTVYTYDSVKHLITEVTYPVLNVGVGVDSTVITYDENGRMVSSHYFINNTLDYSEKWVYDTLNKQIDYYEFTDATSDSVTHIVYKGVKDFDQAPEAILSGVESIPVLGGLSGMILDCDSIVVYQYDNTTWEEASTVKPTYQNGKLNTVKTAMQGFDLTPLGYPMTVDIALELAFNYNGDKLLGINGTLQIITPYMPVSIPNAIVVINQYNEKDLLIESTTIIDISIPMVEPIYFEMKQKYDYNAEDNLSVTTFEGSEDGTVWQVAGKVYYFYNNYNNEDLALFYIDEPSASTGIMGESMDIKVYLENKSISSVYQNVNITAVIQDAQKNITETFTETIDQIDPASLSSYEFSYTVPNGDTVYFITVYLDSYDNNLSNDTLHLQRSADYFNGDLELLRIDSPDENVNIGETIQVSVTLENKSLSHPFNNVKITALVENILTGEIVATFTETISQIEAATTMFFTFDGSYNVQIHGYYSVTVYIDSCDNDQSNDTISLQFETPINDIKTIDNTTVYMSQNIPNPADNHTHITYSIPEDGQVTFSVYNINGQLLSSQSVDAQSGENTLKLNTDNLASGLYLYAMEFNGRRIVKKMNVSR